MDGIFVDIFMGILIGTTLCATRYLIFMQWIDSDFFGVTEWQRAFEAGA